ncbi:uncharacterized protein LOC126176143 [Schistocerca cancellata]|uniref:uncharacterized protein LOC126176143 n=1 Tax=Schistocerca cancellata TaxID=274614 RepID=UPI00211908C7|nr:uncharacterized protein LOC126176143 [Schistocerca cancellata]
MAVAHERTVKRVVKHLLLPLLLPLLAGASAQHTGDPAALENNLLEAGRGVVSAVMDAVGPCPESGGGITCQGLRLVRQAAAIAESDGPVELARGVTLVKVGGGTLEGARRDTGMSADGGVAASVANFLQGREVRIELAQLVGREEWDSFVNSSLVRSGTQFEGRKKDKGGAGLVLAMGGMMASMMGAMGMAGVALLAMKAIALAGMALILAAAAAVKKMGGGDEGGHHVSVVPVGHGDHGGYHRRRRRAAPAGDAHYLAYGAQAPAGSDARR